MAPQEKFNDVEPFRLRGYVVMEIERANIGLRKRYCGQLWTGDSWLTVAEARQLRDWLNKVIP